MLVEKVARELFESLYVATMVFPQIENDGLSILRLCNKGSSILWSDGKGRESEVNDPTFIVLGKGLRFLFLFAGIGVVEVGKVLRKFRLKLRLNRNRLRAISA